MHSMRRAIAHTALLLAALLASSAAARAQRAEQPAFSVLTFATGATFMSVDALNGALTSAAFPGLSNDGISYGVTGHYALGRAVLGLDAARTTFGEEGLSNGRSDDLNSTILLGTAGYAVYASDRWAAYPILGVGLGHFDVTLRDRNGRTNPRSRNPRSRKLRNRREVPPRSRGATCCSVLVRARTSSLRAARETPLAWCSVCARACSRHPTAPRGRRTAAM